MFGDDYDVMPGGDGGYVEYPDGSWEQFFDDGSSIVGDPATGETYTQGDITPGSDAAPATPVTYTFNPGEYLKIGADLYKFVATQNAQGQRVYTGMPLTQAQVAAMQAQQASMQKWVVPAAIGAIALLMIN